MQIKWRVDLTTEEREHLLGLISKGKRGARTLARARVLLKADEGMTDDAVAAAVNVGYATVGRVRRRFVEEGLEGALKEGPWPGAKPKLDERQCAHVIAVACSEAPEGHDHWTLRLLADKVVELGFAESYSHEAVRQTLKKRPQAVAKANVVHPRDQRRVCSGDGRRAGPVRRTLRREAIDGVF